jgi:membrane protein
VEYSGLHSFVTNIMGEKNRLANTIARVKTCVDYVCVGVWKDARDSIGVRIIKTLNLSFKSFFNKDLQSASMALTYSTVLALVPALALLFAIGRGFGFQNLLQDSLYRYFPSQTTAITKSLEFVDSYLSQASQGVFVGIGLVMLLWTVISLLSTIETAFNKIWDVKQRRSFYRKVSDYTSICLMVPVLMVCSSGISIYMSSAISSLGALTPLLNVVLDALPFFLVCLAFTLSFLLFPNTKVKFKYALFSGIICGISFQILQLLFVNGQIYVSKYNAIYGSFAFLPLMLIWLQLSWLILLFGCMLTYSAQNVFSYNYIDDIRNISRNYYREVSVVIMSILVKRFVKQQKPVSITEIALDYGIPVRLVSMITDKLHNAGLTYYVTDADEHQCMIPSVDANSYTVADLLNTIDEHGAKDFISDFDTRYHNIVQKITPILLTKYDEANSIYLKDLEFE